ncbi:hypothetical protein BRC93_07840 [Halobacteriales archaeon QS_5_70_15]|nr:MAG: hypothetical protein BRC93_07840 [Halobacteriales archaeon QS_5_70_15]
MRRGAGLLLATAILLAGCSGTAPTADRRGASRVTVTPAPVPADRSPTVREGVDGERLVPLASQHGTALADRSFTALGRGIVTGPVGVLLNVRWERRVAVDRETYHAVREGTETWYAAGGTGRHELGSGPERADLDDADYLAGLLRAFDSWRVSRYSNGSLALSGRGLARPEALGVAPSLRDARSAKTEVRVGTDAAIDRVRIRFEATVDGIPVSFVEERRYVAVGATETDRPPWYDAALATATPNATAKR